MIGAQQVPEQDYSGEGVMLSVAANTVAGMRASDICQFSDDQDPPPSKPLLTETIRDIATQAKPSVVNVYVKTATPVRVNILGIPVPALPAIPIPGEALGSGFICSRSGFILTNAHVVNRADKLSAKTEDGRVHELEIVAVDRANDISLVRISPAGDFPSTTLVAADRLSEGDWVIAIGNPLGLTHTVSHGIVSQKNRQVPELTSSGGKELTFLQSDTPINPGNAGGPLFDITGRVVGINTAIARNAQGISFTIPTERVRKFLDQVSELSTRRYGNPRSKL